jgi:hypothetical protein|tara:strand:- start:281 stop:598 length:318 start_codon:yes stop_codon:yes gene_type:complete
MPSNSVYPKTSPYYRAGVIENKFLDVMEPYTAIPRDASDASFTITAKYEFRPDMLAQDLYNDPRLWWVFASRNPNQLGPDPYFNFKTGVQIFVPVMSTLKRVLGI